MKINVLFSPVSADELYFTGKTTVVIDVLRASTTLITALANGAKEIVPVATVEFAVKVSGGMFGGHTLLGGERNTKKLEGFALGNSPSDYISNAVEGKTIVYYTTNGSKAIVKAKFSENLFICSFINISVVAKYLVELSNNIEILCAGNNNLYSLEDSVCAGRLVKEIISQSTECELSDSSKSAMALNKEFGGNILKMLKESEHGGLLSESGFVDDLNICSKLNETNVNPIFSGNVLKLLS
jgi:2-phosphosulfolactate phosphatase